jgi:tetratricopeptide (TPR) repeat protein
MRRIIACLFACLSVNALQAQDLKIPNFSSTQHIEQEFGLGRIDITYGRPNLKSRKIFNNIEPYGVVWRTGANSATVIKFTDTVSVEGNNVLPGEYALFTIPGANEWTVIINKVARQWGAYSYDKKQDLLRFKVKPYRIAPKLETFTIEFADLNVDQGTLKLSWEHTGISIKLKANINARVIANIEQLMKGDNKPYYVAAVWYYYHDLDMNQALAWMLEVEKQQPDAYNVKYWKGRILLKMGNKKGAIAAAKIGLEIAERDENDEYIRMNKNVLREAGYPIK